MRNIRAISTRDILPRLLMAAATACIGLAAYAQGAAKTVWNGAYTADQAERGKAAYATNCASCHGATLAGIDVAPQLAGPGFLANWSGTKTSDLFVRIKTTMPLTAPGSLPGRTVADVEAFILQSNGFPAGSVAIPAAPAAMGAITITSTKPAG